MSKHTISYRLRNHDLDDPRRPVEVAASPAELASFARDGFLVRPKVLSDEQIVAMRAAVDEVAARDDAEVSTSRRFGGHFLRHLLDKHEAFHDLITCRELLGIARAMLGPQIQIRGLAARIAVPDEARQETHWHFHQRAIPDPRPPFFMAPQTIDCLIYLDDVTNANGPLYVVPGSHLRLDEDLAGDDWSDKADQIVLRPQAGTAVMCHGSLWHRALPNTPQGSVRRLLLFGFGATWMKPSIYGKPVENGLTQKLLQDADEETRELLGLAGYF